MLSPNALSITACALRNRPAGAPPVDPGDPIDPVFTPAYVDDFETPGPLLGRANWEQLNTSLNWQAIGGTSRMLTNFGAASVVLFGPPEGFGGDVMFRVGYNTNAADPGGQAFTTVVSYRLWEIDESNYLQIAVDPSLKRITVGGMVAGASVSPPRWNDVPVNFDERGDLAVLLGADGTIRIAINGRWLKGFAINPQPRDVGDYSAIFPPAARAGRVGIRSGTRAYAVADYIEVDVAGVTIDRVPGFVRRHGKDATQGSVPIRGKYLGVPERIAYRILNDAGVPQGAWQLVADPAFTAGRWTGTATIPVGGPWTIEIAYQQAGGKWFRTWSTRILCGIFALYYGQSNAVGRGDRSWTGTTPNIQAASYAKDGVDVLPMWAGDEWPLTKMAMHELANRLSALTGLPVGVAATGYPAVGLDYLKPGAPGWSTFTTFVDMMGAPEVVLWDQGEADGDSTMPYPSTYATRFINDLVGPIRTYLNNPTLPVLPIILGKFVNGTPPNGIETGLSSSQRNLLARSVLSTETMDPNVHVMSWGGGREHADGYHYTGAGYTEASRREAYTVARYVYGVNCPDGAGPRVVAATRAGAVITLSLDMRGFTGLTGTAIKGYEVSANNFATTLPTTSVEVSGNTIVITLAADPGGPVKVRSYYGWTYDDSSMAGGIAPGVDPIPVLPIFDPLTAA
ncbi:hypothetical protein G432_05280 [Sphingomonas sp. MM-1]|nr:hypothetical protein G432_05280 [Sphingomonas sp. MM-1]